MRPDSNGAMASAAALAALVPVDAAADVVAAEPETATDAAPDAAALDPAGAKRPYWSGASDSPRRMRSSRSRRFWASWAAAILPCSRISSLRARRPAWPEIR